MLKQILQLKKTKSAIAISVAMVGIFGVMQAMETQGATTSQMTLTTTVSSAISVSCATTVAFGALVSGTPDDQSSSCSVTTNAANGYHLQIKSDNGNGSTLKFGAIALPDATAWNSTSPNSAVWGSQKDLAFRVMLTGTTPAAYSSTWWGTDDTGTNAKYAGLPTAYQDIVNDTAYSSASTTAIIEFKVDVPSTQNTGAYTGTATVSTTASP